MSLRQLLQMDSRMQLMARGHAEPSFKKLGANLMNQQCWCWGCDIRRSQGNLLLAFGCERLRPPAEATGSSRYRFVLRSGYQVSLWGFGVLVENHTDAIHVGRFEFDPHLCKPLGDSSVCWAPAGLKPLRRPSSTRELLQVADLCTELLSFIGQYESWITETMGIRYRQQTLDKFQHTTYSATEAKELWPRLAKQVGRHYGKRATARRMN